MRVWLSGGSGFLGSTLQALLRDQGAEIVAPTSTELDVRDAAAVAASIRAARPEQVFHLAALTSIADAEADPGGARSINVGGTESVLTALAQHAPAARVVLTSTCHVYGPPQELPHTESHPLQPATVYAESKLGAEGRARHWAVQGVAVVICRPFHLTGPGQPERHAAASWAAQSARGVDPIRVGELSLRRDFLDVRDAARGLLVLAASGQPGETYNLCSGQAVPLSQVFDRVAPGKGHLVDPERVRDLSTPVLVGDPRKLARLGWEPRIPLQRSLAELAEDYSSRTSI